jgi:hypothetical protein
LSRNKSALLETEVLEQPLLRNRGFSGKKLIEKAMSLI